VFWFGKNDMLAAESFHDSVTHWKEAGIYGPGPRGGDATGITPGVHSFLFPPTHEDRRHTHDFALVQSAFDILERKESERPFCIFLALTQPHPSGSRGVNEQGMIELYDMMQTCLDLAGTEAQHTHFARSLLPQARGNPGDPNRAAFAETGVNVYEPQCFEAAPQPDSLYGPKLKLLMEHPELFSRCATVRTREAKLIVRPHGQSELYNYKPDPQERENIYGERSAASLQEQLQQRLLHWYINTTGIAPFDKDERNCPRINDGRRAPDQGWQQALLDS
jgi:hypothetical protein